jgi:hypothetical protein
MADEKPEKTPEPAPTRKPRGPVLLEALFAGAQIATSVTGAVVFAVSLLTGTLVEIAVFQALVATATVGAVMWSLHWLVTHGLLAARKAELEAAVAADTAAVGTQIEVEA